MPSRILRLWNPSASAWEEVGDSRLTAHLAAADPHGQYVLETLADAKGDLLAASAADTVGRLPLGTDGQVLTADSAQALGVKWAPAAAGGGYLPLSGGTMSGTITADGTTADVGTGGALRVTASGASATDLRLTGAGHTLTGTTSGGVEVGIRFHATAAVKLYAVRWWRQNAGQPAPTAVHLWDSTATATAVWTYGTTPPEFADTATGAKEYRLPAGTQPTLVSGRVYALSYATAGGASVSQNNATAPTPDGPLVVDAGGVYAGGNNAYPGTAGSAWYGMDGAFRLSTGGTNPAASGAIRLPNGTGGAVAWRNAGDTADLALTVDATNALTFGGAALQTQTAADARYLQLSGGQLTGDLVLSEATPTVSLKLAADTQPRSRLSDTALAFGPGGTTATDTTLQRTGAGALTVGAGAAAASLAVDGAVVQLGKALSGNGGQLRYVDDGGTVRWMVGIDGAAGGRDFVVQDYQGGQVRLRLNQASGYVRPGGHTFPSADNAYELGDPGGRWTTVYAVAGTINTSLAEAKEAITPLDPTAAMAAVRATTPVTFDYKPPERGAEWYELPDDPEQAEAVLYQRLVTGPLEEAARHQHGVVLGSDQFPCDPLFQCGEGQTSPGSSVGVILAALQSIDARLTALETP